MKSRRYNSLVACLAALTLAGCNLGWTRPDTSLPPPERFRAAAPVSAPPMHGAQDFIGQFQSRELTALVDEALAKNYDIAAAVARIAEADATARTASVALFPLLTLNTSTQRTQTPVTAVPPAQLTSSQSSGQTVGATRTNLSRLGLSASYEFDFWGKNDDASKAARLLANATRFDRSTVEIATVASVLNAYFQALNTRDRLQIAHRNVEIAEGVLEALRIRLEVGTGTILDVAQQATVASTQRAAIPQLEQTLIQQSNILAVLLGRLPERFDLRGPSLAALHFPALQPGLPSEVLLRRPDVAAAEARLASQEFSVLQARAAFFPSITLTGQYGLQSIVFRNLTRPEAIAWQILGNAAQPLFDGDNLHSQYMLQKAKFAELTANYRKQLVTALSETENALVAVAKTTERLQQQAEAVQNARIAMEAAQGRLRAGTIDVVTLATTQTAFFQNRDTLEQVRLARYQAAISLYQALGGGWTPTTRDRQIAMANAAFVADRGPWP